jgi:hypothetical protein
MGYVGMKCIKGYKLQVLKSPAGYYLGTVDKDGFPNCRVSIEYCKTREQAEILIPNRVCDENLFCSNYKGCQFR